MDLDIATPGTPEERAFDYLPTDHPEHVAIRYKVIACDDMTMQLALGALAERLGRDVSAREWSALTPIVGSLCVTEVTSIRRGGEDIATVNGTKLPASSRDVIERVCAGFPWFATAAGREADRLQSKLVGQLKNSEPASASS